MKKRLLLVAMLSICILLSASVTTVNAAASWYDQCVVSTVCSYNGGTGLVYLSGGPQNLPAQYYTLGRNVTESNQFMAVALTAITLGAKVGVTVDPLPLNTNPVIQVMVVSAP
jgi:hypothetical protein